MSENRNTKKISRIAILLNDRSFEYDVYTLVIAFCQGVPVRVLDLMEKSSEDTDLNISVSIKTESDLNHIEAAGACPDGGLVTNISITADMKDGRHLHTHTCVPGGDSTCGRQERNSGADQAFDTHEGKTGMENAGGDKVCTGTAVRNAGGDKVCTGRTAVKNALKGSLYKLLCDLTGRTLPWGNLTGIRPVKLATEFLLQEEQDLSSDDAEDLPLQEAELLRRTAGDMVKTYFTSREKAELAAQIASREQKILRKIKPENGYSLYIGIPFCPSICLYCSFSSGTIGVWQKETDHYVDTLVHEIEACGRRAERPCFPDKILQTVYIGGGTPTTLSPDQMERLFLALEENFDMDSVLEFTVEAGRPDTITEEKLEVMKKHHVSRISINPQTMNQKTLDMIGRRHTVEQTVGAFSLARSMGFDNINMDLIVGLPGEGLPEVDHTMQMLEKLDPDDITVHALALKRAARLALHMDEYESISFQASDAIMQRTQETCRRLGMTPYYLYRQKNMAGNFENVGCAKKGRAGLYNILIMEEVQSILALGASGSTKVILPGGRIERIENVKDVRGYLDRIEEMIARKDALR